MLPSLAQWPGGKVGRGQGRTDTKVTSGLLAAICFSFGYSRRQPLHQGTKKSAATSRCLATMARNASGLTADSRFAGSSPSHLAPGRCSRLCVRVTRALDIWLLAWKAS